MVQNCSSRDLLTWSQDGGIDLKQSCVQVHNFEDTGRGVQALTPIEPGSVIVAVPVQILLTNDVTINSPIGQVCKK